MIKKIYSVTLKRTVDDTVDSWEEILCDQLFDQKKKLANLALSIESRELANWVLGWKFDDPEISNLEEAFKKISSEFPNEDVPDAFIEFWMHGIMAQKIAFEEFMSGEFEKAMSSAFSIQYYIGLRTGELKEKINRGKSQRNKDDLEDKKLVLIFYTKNDFEELSNDAAAAKLVDVKPKLTGMKARTLSLLISKYKKFLAKCNVTDAGRLLLEKQRQALSIISQNSASEAAIQNARNFVRAKEENDIKRVEAFVELGEEGYMYANYFDQMCLAAFP